MLLRLGPVGGGVGKQPGDAFQQTRLAASRRAEDEIHLARLEDEVDVVQDCLLAVGRHNVRRRFGLPLLVRLRLSCRFLRIGLLIGATGRIATATAPALTELMQPTDELERPVADGLVGHRLDGGGVHLDGDVARHVPEADLHEALRGLGLEDRLALGVLRRAAGHAPLGGGEAGTSLGGLCRREDLLLVIIGIDVLLADALQDGRGEGHPFGPGGLVPFDEGLEVVRAAALGGRRLRRRRRRGILVGLAEPGRHD